jgi:hypothetical protein
MAEYTLNENIFYDVNGNIFIKNKDNYYWLNIDRNNKPDLELVEDLNVLSICPNDIKFNKIKYEENKLKNKILEKKDSPDANVSNISNISLTGAEDLNIMYNADGEKVSFEYFPEDKDYYVEEGVAIKGAAKDKDKYKDKYKDKEEEDEEEEEEQEEIEDIFKFYRYDNNNYINYLVHAFDTNSIYDTLILHNNNVVMKLESSIGSAYRITINQNTIICNVVGESIRGYKCIVDDAGLHIVNL